MWSRYGYRVNLARFFQVTAIFLLVFVVQLLIYGFHELTEANVLPGSERFTGRRNPTARDGVSRPLPELPARCASAWWLAVSSLFGKRPDRDRRSVGSA